MTPLKNILRAATAECYYFLNERMNGPSSKKKKKVKSYRIFFKVQFAFFF